jgi:hypothetical protein
VAVATSAHAVEDKIKVPDSGPSPAAVRLNNHLTAWVNHSRSEVESDRPGERYEGDITTSSLGLEWSEVRWAVGVDISHSESLVDTPGSSDERNERRTSVTPYLTWKVLPFLHLKAFAGISEGDFYRQRSAVRFPVHFTGETNTQGNIFGLSAIGFAPIGPGLLSTAVTWSKNKTTYDAFTEASSDLDNFKDIDNPRFKQEINTLSVRGQYLISLGKFMPFATLGWFDHRGGNLYEADSNGYTWGGGAGYRFTPNSRIAVQYQQLEDKQYEDNKTLAAQFMLLF